MKYINLKLQHDLATCTMRVLQLLQDMPNSSYQVKENKGEKKGFESVVIQCPHGYVESCGMFLVHGVGDACFNCGADDVTIIKIHGSCDFVLVMAPQKRT